jgi:hypothetical protein
MQWMNPAAYDFSAVSGSTGDMAGFNFMDPNSWTQFAQPQAPAESQ